MNFRDLEYVVEAARQLNFTKAAQNCHVSQPSLSAQIKKLEDSLGVPIFVRSKRKVHLTAFGEGFVKKARAILDMAEEMRLSANECKNPLEGKLLLGGILTVAPYVFPAIIQHIHRYAPHMQLLLSEAKTQDLLQRILEGEVDLAIISLPTDEQVFESRFLFNEPFFLAVSKDHPLAGAEKVSENMLRDENLILLEEGHCFRNQALEVCHSLSAGENQTFRATSLETIRHFVATGEGVTLMPAMACRPEDGIAYIPLDNPKFSRDIGMVWLKSNGNKPQIEQLFSMIEELFEGGAGTRPS